MRRGRAQCPAPLSGKGVIEGARPGSAGGEGTGFMVQVGPGAPPGSLAHSHLCAGVHCRGCRWETGGPLRASSQEAASPPGR